MGQIKWSEKAVIDLEAIFNYISTNSPIYASRFINSIIKSTDILKSQPFLGRIVPEFDNNTIRELIYRDYRIVYRIVIDDNVEILIVFHGKRELSNIE